MQRDNNHENKKRRKYNDTNNSISKNKKNNQKPSTFDDLVVKVQGVLEASPADMNRGLKSKPSGTEPQPVTQPAEKPHKPLTRWEFSKIRGTVVWGPSYKDPSI